MALTDKQVKEAAPPAKSRRVMSDDHKDAPRGFALVLRKSGTRSFVLRYAGRSGKDRLVTIGEYPTWSLKAARERAAELRREIDAGNDPLEDKRDQRAEPTVADAVERFCLARADKQKRGKDVRAAFYNHLVPALGDTKLREVRRRDVLPVLEKLARQHPRQAALLLTHSKQLFEWAEDRELVEQSPVASLKPKRIGEGITPKTCARVLYQDEIQALWNTTHVPGLAHPTLTALKLILLTGQRPGEVIGLRWSEIDGEWWTIPASRRGKTDSGHRVPLTATALALLETLRKGDDLVFARKPGAEPGVATLSKAVRRSADALGNRADDEEGHWTPHDLRRTARTGMGAAGVSEHSAERTIGHTKKGIAGVYDQHHYDREKRAALEAWERRLALIAAGEDPDAGNVVSLGAAQ